MKGDLWKTKAGVHVFETERRLERRREKREVKVHTVRAGTGGDHGWVWLRNLTPLSIQRKP